MPQTEGGYTTVGRTRKKYGAPPAPPHTAKRLVKRTKGMDDPLVDMVSRERFGETGEKTMTVLEDLGLLPTDKPSLAEILEELERYRDMRGPLPDIRGAMDDAARDLGLGDLEQEPPHPWLQLMARRPEVTFQFPDPEPWDLEEQAENGGIEGPPPEALRGFPQEPIWPEQLNASPLDPRGMSDEQAGSRWAHKSPEWWEAQKEWSRRDRVRERIANDGGNLPSFWEPQPEGGLRSPSGQSTPPDMWDDWELGPDDLPSGNALNFDVAGGLMDMLQTPGFKIGLGGTGALIGLLSYLGANAAEEIIP